MVRMTSACMVVLALMFSACASAPRTNETARVRFVITPDTARVYTDDQFVGGARVLAVRPAVFRPGPRRVTITALGHFPHDLDLFLEPGTTTIEVRLRPIPP